MSEVVISILAVPVIGFAGIGVALALSRWKRLSLVLLVLYFWSCGALWLYELVSGHPIPRELCDGWFYSGIAGMVLFMIGMLIDDFTT